MSLHGPVTTDYENYVYMCQLANEMEADLITRTYHTDAEADQLRENLKSLRRDIKKAEWELKRQ